jgi:hypothetical protein
MEGRDGRPGRRGHDRRTIRATPREEKGRDYERRRGGVRWRKERNRTGTWEGVCNKWKSLVISIQIHEEV